MKNGKIILLCLVGVFFFLMLISMIENDTSIADKVLVDKDNTSTAEHHYYMKNQNGNIIVFNKDHTIFEYTDLIPEFLPEDVKSNLIHGIYFQNQKDLYEFLETSSS